MKYTKESLGSVVAISYSMAEVLRKLGLTGTSGGMHSYLSKRLKEFEIDTSHFLGIKAGSWTAKKPYKKLHWSDVLVIRQARIHGHRLKKAMIESGVPHECVACGLGPVWNDLPLVLQVEHKNGNGLDCRPENVEFRCPNCHTQTATYAVAKTLNGTARKCDCGKRLHSSNKSGTCAVCQKLARVDQRQSHLV